MNNFQFGATIGEMLVTSQTSDVVPKIAAAQMVAGLLGKCETAKLPQIVANPQVREWMTAAGVTENLLRRALTDARKSLRADADAALIVTPPKRRKRTKLAEPHAARTTTTSRAPGELFDDDGFVPN
ncbi:hypothetical protein [Sphingomonas sp. ID0503]|uniref:hypothetical protein n=1 Tax=Sphingomonas sp. ID0503 TaxID=3399691 RepID=UPI003AFB6DF0